MMRRYWLLASVALVVLVPLVGGAECTIGQSVVASGGGAMSGGAYTMLGTVGQAAIGVASGPQYTNEIGFWYQPGWILTGVPTLPWTPVFGLEQNCPNPFNPVTTLRFSLARDAQASIKLYDAKGREVRTLVDAELPAGRHVVTLDGAGLASGVYFCRMVAGEFVETRKLVLLK